MDFTVRRGKYNRPLFEDVQVQYMVEKYTQNKNVSLFSLSKEFKVSPKSIERVMTEENVQLKSLRDYRLIYELNESFFDEIDTEEKSYWLGFLYADGTINESENLVRVNLSAVDRNHLEKFRESVGSTHPIKKTGKVTEEKTYYGAYIGFKSAHMVSTLSQKGCFQNKTKKLTFPSSDIVPDDLIRHFIRGYFDGDGSISYSTNKKTGRRMYKIGITGTEDIVDSIKLHFNSSVKTQIYNEMRVIQPGGNQQCKRLYEYMYRDANTYLTRKSEIFLDMVKYMDSNQYVVWNKGLRYKIIDNTHMRTD